METTFMGYIGTTNEDPFLPSQREESKHLQPNPWMNPKAGNEGMEKKMEATLMAYIGTSMRIHSFISSNPWMKPASRA